MRLAPATHGMDLLTPLHSQGLRLIAESIEMASDVPAVMRLNGSKGMGMTKAEACEGLVARLISVSKALQALKDWEGAAATLQCAKVTLAKGPVEAQKMQYLTSKIIINEAWFALGKVGSADLERWWGWS